ncbi:MAG TPA: hypothetical protein VKX17_23180 [Planctomycetota bacterium]|nr:hypothetical protein [Planctomycetota bacterium]
MKRFLALAVAAMFCFGTYSASVRAEEKVEIKKNDKEFKMKIKHKDKDWVGEYDGHTYILRGEPTIFETIKDDGDYTVYGTLAPDNTYITTTKITRIETK